MNIKTALEIIADGENSRVEFKKKINEPVKVAKEITALANTKGGYIFVGVEDNGHISGIYSEKSEIQTIEQACSFYIIPNIKVEIDILRHKSKYILVVEVPESDSKPHFLIIDDPVNKRTDKKVFVRMGEKSVPASSEMSRLLREQNGTGNTGIRIDFGENEKRLFRYLEKYEKITIQDFARLVNISKRRSERSLIQLVRAGVLTMHNDSTRDYFTMIPI
jgi:predicted HTH transcriptional regulator